MPEEIEVPAETLAEENVEQVEEVTPPVEEFELSDLDVELYNRHTVTVKIDGVETKVPIAEAVAGYQTQAAATRKFQELAAQKEQLGWAAAIRAALDNDPRGTLQLLSDHYGLGGIANPATPSAEAGEDPLWSDEAVDPRYTSLEQRLAVFEEREATAQLHAELNGLREKYGEDFDPQEVVTEAVRLGSTDLESTYKLLAFDRVRTGTSKAAAKAEQSAATTAAKRAGGLAAGGSNPAPVVEDEPITSIADAWRAAKREHGG